MKFRNFPRKLSIKAAVSIGAFVLLPLMAKADVDVSCLDNDCMISGWATIDLINRMESVSICINDDCEFVGWVTESRGREVSRTECKPAGCFQEGWRDIDPRTNRVTADIQCIRSYFTTDCLVNGWTANVPGRPQVTARCVANDCYNNGWDVFVRGYQPQPVRCKQGGCFTSGWRILRLNSQPSSTVF